MAIKYIKKADKTPSSDEVETRQRVQEILQQIAMRKESISSQVSIDLEYLDSSLE